MGAFNRTRMELKLGTSNRLIFIPSAFNRTRMELKLCGEGKLGETGGYF